VSGQLKNFGCEEMGSRAIYGAPSREKQAGTFNGATENKISLKNTAISGAIYIHTLEGYSLNRS
jgi:hypothetical protein